MTRKRKFFFITAACLAIYFIAVFFVLSMVITHIAPDKLAAQTGRPVTIDQIRVNPFTFSVTVRGFEIKDTNKTDPFFRFETLYANVDIISLLKRGLILKSLHLEKPKINIVRLSGTSFNFSDLIPGKKKDEPDAPDGKTAPSRPLLFAVADIAIIDGAVDYRDIPENKTHTITPINWHLPFISNFSKYNDKFSNQDLICTVDGTPVSVDVNTKPFKESMDTIVDIAISGLSLPRYISYIPSDLIGFQLVQGVLDFKTRISLRKEKGAIVATVQGDMAFANLNIADMKGGEIFTMHSLQLTLLPSVVTENRLHIGDFIVQAPELSTVRKADGTINLSGLIKDSDSKNEEKNNKIVSKKDSGKAFHLDVDRFALTSGTVRFTDFATKGNTTAKDTNPVETTINDLNITVDSFSTTPEKQSQFKLSTKINNSSPFDLNGHMTLTPLTVESDISLSELSLAWCQPYIPKNIKLLVTEGTAAASSHISLTRVQDNKFSAIITGKTAIRNFASFDSEKTESFLRWKDFTIDGAKVSVWPLRVSVDKIAFNGLKNQLMVFEDGISSIEKIFTREGETVSGPSAEPSVITPIRIGKFLLNNAEVRFMDKSVSPHYSSKLSLKKLSLIGLTSEDFKAADVSANGAIDGYAPVSITGTINPLAKDLFVDLDVKFTNIEMVPFSTYTGKFIGKAIEKGKLNIDVKYYIKNKVIAANNHLLIDQFTLGKDVESPDAMHLPVGLAIALLKDRNGVINVNLPISGRTDDPDFAWGKVVIKALGNLIMKAGTSPFALVSSLVGGGEELRFIEFEPGAADLDEAGLEKLKAVRIILAERPALKMEIVGYADITTDRKALAELVLDRKIKSYAFAKVVRNRKSQAKKTLDSIILPPEKRERILRKLYKKEVVVKPDHGIPVKKANDSTLTVEEMKTALLKLTVVTDADLQFLAMERAEQVQESLLHDQTVSAERIFLKELENPFKTVSDDFKASRVELVVN